MSKFHKLKVADIKAETSDCVSVAFEVPSELKNDYNFIQGQYLTLKLFVKGEEIRRSYSICSGVDDNELRVAIKRVSGGKGSNFVNDNVKPGDSIEVMIPMGNFYTQLNSSNKKNYVLFAGGSGITPMLSIIKTVLKKEVNSTITLFYGNQNESSIIFKKQLDELQANNTNRLKVYHILDKAPANHPILLQGMMTPEKNMALIENYVGLNLDNEFFVCGPGPMMDSVKQTLEKLKIDSKRIHIEYFTAPAEPTDKPKKSAAEFVDCTATIVLDGDEVVLQVKAGQTILDVARDAGLDAPYACKGGSCCTCRAKLLEGNVEMAVNYALLPEEVEQGYILTCQSMPTTDTVKVDYDQAN